MLEDIHKNWIKLKEERNSANFSRWSLRKFFRTRKEKKEWKEKSENSLSSIPKASSRDLHVCGVVLANRKIPRRASATASMFSRNVYSVGDQPACLPNRPNGGCVHGDLGMLVHCPLCMQVYKAWRVKVCVCIYVCVCVNFASRKIHRVKCIFNTRKKGLRFPPLFIYETVFCRVNVTKRNRARWIYAIVGWWIFLGRGRAV